MSELSIAICISGQIRTPISELQKLADEARACGADVFLSVWSEAGLKTFEGAVGPKNIRRIIGKEMAQLVPDAWLGKMKEVFPDFKKFFPTKNIVDPQELAAIFKGAIIEIEDDGPQFDLAQNDSNSLRMLYKIWRANQLKRLTEKQRGKRYDLVLRIRADMLFDGAALGKTRLEPDSILVQGHANNRKQYINDMIWATSSKNDDAVSDLYHKCKNSAETGWAGIHRELYEIVIANGLKPNKITAVKGGIEGTHSLNDNAAEYVGKNLIRAIVEKNLAQDKAGGPAFCDLVSITVDHRLNNDATGAWLPDGLPQLLDAIEAENRNFYMQALIYLSGLYILDKSMPAPDRLELMFRVLSYYCFRNAVVHLDVRTAEMDEIFDNHAVELQQALCIEPVKFESFQTDLPKMLATRFDHFWDTRIKADRAEPREAAIKKLLSTPKFVIGLHRILSNTAHHKEAFELAKSWVAIDPKNWRAYDLLAASAQALGWLELAENIYRDAEENTQPNSRLQELKGNLLARLGKLEGSRSAFEFSLRISGGNKKRVGQSLEKIQKRIQNS